VGVRWWIQIQIAPSPIVPAARIKKLCTGFGRFEGLVAEILRQLPHKLQVLLKPDHKPPRIIRLGMSGLYDHGVAQVSCYSRTKSGINSALHQEGAPIADVWIGCIQIQSVIPSPVGLASPCNALQRWIQQEGPVRSLLFSCPDLAPGRTMTMTLADFARENTKRTAVNRAFNRAILECSDGSHLLFEHSSRQNRWAKASEQGTVADRICRSLAQFRLNAKHLELFFDDDSRTEFPPTFWEGVDARQDGG
jgi:hypothetical protein